MFAILVCIDFEPEILVLNNMLEEGFSLFESPLLENFLVNAYLFVHDIYKFCFVRDFDLASSFELKQELTDCHSNTSKLLNWFEV